MFGVRCSLPPIPLRNFHLNNLVPARIQLNLPHRRRPPHHRPKFRRAPQHFLIQRRAIHLKRRHTRQIFPANLRAIIQLLRVFIGEPKTHPLLHQMRFIEILREPQHTTEKITAHLHRRLAHAPAKDRGFFQDQNPQTRLLTQQQDRRRRARQRAARDHHIVVWTL